MINMAYRPFCTTGLNSLQSFTLIAQFLTLFVGIMIMLTKATAVSEEDGGGGVNKFEATVVAFVITVINVATLGWPFLRKLIGGDYFTYLKWAKIILYKWPIRVYNKLFGVGGWFGPEPKRPVLRPVGASIKADLCVPRCVVHTHT